MSKSSCVFRVRGLCVFVRGVRARSIGRGQCVAGDWWLVGVGRVCVWEARADWRRVHELSMVCAEVVPLNYCWSLPNWASRARHGVALASHSGCESGADAPLHRYPSTSGVSARTRFMLICAPVVTPVSGFVVSVRNGSVSSRTSHCQTGDDQECGMSVRTAALTCRESFFRHVCAHLERRIGNGKARRQEGEEIVADLWVG